MLRALVHGLYFEKKGPRALVPSLQLSARTGQRMNAKALMFLISATKHTHK